MRLDWLEISDFKNLKQFRIDFDEDQLTTVLIGQNGTGKSNLIEALVLIFKDLDLGNRPSFAYRIRYQCRGHEIEIHADPARGVVPFYINVDGDLPSFAKFRRNAASWLPNHVFAYYSGPSRRLETHFNEHQDQFYRALLRDDDRPFRRLFFCRLVHSQFVLMAYFCSDDRSTRDFLERYLGIIGIESVLFILREPSWSKSNPSDQLRAKGDPRFWYAYGVVKGFLGKLWDSSLAPIYHEDPVQDDYRRPAADEQRLYLYLKDEKSLRDLAAGYPTPAEFFKHLESTDISDLVREVRIKVRRRDTKEHLTFKELSEGEQQLLTVLGMLKFTKDEESLFLLDEPDTHLNPIWKLRYLTLLEDVVGAGKSSHLIIATHDPLVIGGLEKDQVQILTRRGGLVKAQPPHVDPRGLGVAGVLTRMFGLPSTLDPPTQRLLDERNELFIKPDKDAKDLARMRELSTELAAMGFMAEDRDPLFAEFLRALAAVERSEDRTYSPDELRLQEQTADNIIAELLAKEAST
jgi:predicted ATPase